MVTDRFLEDISPLAMEQDIAIANGVLDEFASEYSAGRFPAWSDVSGELEFAARVLYLCAGFDLTDFGQQRLIRELRSSRGIVYSKVLAEIPTFQRTMSRSIAERVRSEESRKGAACSYPLADDEVLF